MDFTSDLFPNLYGKSTAFKFGYQPQTKNPQQLPTSQSGFFSQNAGALIGAGASLLGTTAQIGLGINSLRQNKQALEQSKQALDFSKQQYTDQKKNYDSYMTQTNDSANAYDEIKRKTNTNINVNDQLPMEKL